MADFRCAYTGKDYESDGSGFGDFLGVVTLAINTWATVKGVEVEPCGKPAEYYVNGMAVCLEHALELADDE